MALLLGVSAPIVAPILLQPNHLHWTAGTGMMRGISIAPLLGDLDKAGEFVVRLRLPAGASWPPHFHKKRLNATVVSGELLLGLGTTVQRKSMIAYPAGSFISIPPNTPYYDATVGPTVVEESGQGPVVSITAASP